MLDISFSLPGSSPRVVRGPIPDGEIVPSASRTRARPFAESHPLTCVRITVTIRGNDNAHRAPIAVVTKSTRFEALIEAQGVLPVPELVPPPPDLAADVVGRAAARRRRRGGVASSRCATSAATSRRTTPPPARDGRGARTLIVEGWLEEDGLDAAIALIARGRYERVVTSGGPIEAGARASRGRPTPSAPPTTCAATASAAIPVVAVAAPESAQDRTFLSAVVVRDWLRRQGGTRRRGRSLLGRRPRAPLAARLPDRLRARGRRRRLRRRAAPLRARPLVDDERGRKSVLGEAISLAWTTCCFAPPAPGSHEERSPVPRSPA